MHAHLTHDYQKLCPHVLLCLITNPHAQMGGRQHYDFLFPTYEGEPDSTAEGAYGIHASTDAFKAVWEPLGYEGFFDPALGEEGRIQLENFIDRFCYRGDSKPEGAPVYWFEIM